MADRISQRARNLGPSGGCIRTPPTQGWDAALAGVLAPLHRTDYNATIRADQAGTHPYRVRSALSMDENVIKGAEQF